MRLDLVDGTYELFRAHFSKRPDHFDRSGKDLKATVGLASSLLTLLQEAKHAVTHIAVAFDNPIRCFRNELFAGYKSDEGVPPELHAQFDDVEEAVRALGVTVWSMDRWEADDALASGAHQFAGAVEQVRIHTVDKDLGQCIRGTRVVQVDRRQEKVIDEPALRALRGIGPSSIPDWLALVGDTADGIPGLDGFGEKGAAALLARYEKLEAIPSDCRKWDVKIRGADRLSATLEAHREEAKLYRTLATLVTDVPLKEPLEALRWNGVPKERFLAWCETADLESMRSRPGKWG
jgi:5'-3' exonuclease